MKIGILTFHWATNYGAVLQCYALQKYLCGQGHEVEVINYKPRKFDFWWKYLKRPWLLFNLSVDLRARRKEVRLDGFRRRYLNLSKRYYSSRELYEISNDYEVVISGSDQILNPSFTLAGEDKPTSAYYLDAFSKSYCVGYAVSFGCDVYPQKSLVYARRWINCLKKIGIREQSGLEVLSQMEYCGEKKLVPDPTILMGKDLFSGVVSFPHQYEKNYLCVYVLRKHIEVAETNVLYIDDYNNPFSLEDWLGAIVQSKGLITNSYHGMIVAILNRIPFVVIADSINMNGRFQTLLSQVELLNRMIDNVNDYNGVMEMPIDWERTEYLLHRYRKIGTDFLKFEV